jgi:CRISPR-associated endoribonuclease Cas6
MRLYIYADSGTQPRFHIPWNAHLSFQAFVYDAVNEYAPAYATTLHQDQHAPPFSFSEFIQTEAYDVTDDGLLCEGGYWIVNSPDSELLNACANYGQAHDELTLGHTTIPVAGVEVDNVRPLAGRARYKTVSPIAVSEPNGDRDVPTEWYRPDDGMWYARVCQNVRDRLLARHEEADPEFVIDQLHWTDPKLLKVGPNAKIPCVRCELTLTCDEQTSRFIQEEGIGEKTGMGFGAVVPAEEQLA